MTSTMPEPQTPVTPVRRVDASKPGLVRPAADEPMTRKRGSRVSLSIRTRSIAPGAARWPHEICAPSKAGPGRRRGGEQPVPRAEDDLGVRADVDEQRDLVREVRRLGEDRPGRVRADVAGDARQHVDARAGVAGQLQLARRRTRTARVGRERERRRAERRRVDAEQEVMHDRIARRS